MFFAFWNDFLYQPLFNFLIWIYNTWTDGNLGWAVVYLTILLRVVLLPFTLITERNQIRNEALVDEVRAIEKAYAKDPVLKKQEVRRILKKRRVQPWAKVVTIGVQVLVLVLLYQVFLRGITGEKILKILYPTVDFPGTINTDFYGFDLGARHDWLWAGAVGLFLFLEVYLELQKRKRGLGKGDLAYGVLFPAFVFLLLWWLPMVKSLFILTSILFSVIIGWFSRSLFRKRQMPAAHA